MTTSHKIFPSHRLLVFHCAGVITDKEMIDSCQTIIDDPDMQPGFNNITDMRGATSINFSSGAMQLISGKLAAYHGDLSSDIRSAHVIGNSFHYGMSHMFASYAAYDSLSTVQAFEDLTAALEWLGVSSAAETEIRAFLETAQQTAETKKGA